MKKKKKNDIFAEDIRKMISRALFIFVAFFGIVFIIFGAYAVVKEINIKSTYTLKEATVIANFEKEDKKGNTFYIPTYIYEVNDKSYTVQSDIAYDTMPKVGSTDFVYYNSNNPSDALVKVFEENQLLVVIGILMLILPLAIYLLDVDSQKYDEKADLKALFVIFFSVVSYILSVILTGTFNINSIYNISGVLILVPTIFVIMSVYSLIMIKKYQKTNKKKVK